MIFRSPQSISCVMITNRHLDEIIPSVYCYLRQEHSPKELVIISKATDEQNDEIAQFVESLNREDIQFFGVPHNISDDSMNSLSTDLAKCEILCHWSDRDLSHRNRLQLQSKCLLDDNRRMFCLYSNYLEYRQNIFWRDCLKQKFPLCEGLMETLMYHRVKFCEFNTINARLGYAANIQKLMLEGNLGLVSAGYSYIHFAENEEVGEFYFDEQQINNNRSLIERTLEDVDMKDVSLIANEQIIFRFLHIKK